MGGSLLAIRPESGAGVGGLPSFGLTPTGSPCHSCWLGLCPPKEEPGVPLPPGLIVDSVASAWEYRYTPEAPGNLAPIPTPPACFISLWTHTFLLRVNPASETHQRRGSADRRGSGDSPACLVYLSKSSKS